MMVTIRSAKTKGSQFEMDCEYSLKQKYYDIKRLGGSGQYQEKDLVSEKDKLSFECKRHKSFSWNELKKYLDKLTNRTHSDHKCYLLLKSNHNPCLVMWCIKMNEVNTYFVSEFESYFQLSFVKHKTEKIRNEIKTQ